MTKTLVDSTFSIRLPGAAGFLSELLTQGFQILEALAKRFDRIARSLILLDEVMLHAGLFGGAQHGGNIDGAVAEIVKCGPRDHSR